MAQTKFPRNEFISKKKQKIAWARSNFRNDDDAFVLFQPDLLGLPLKKVISTRRFCNYSSLQWGGGFIESESNFRSIVWGDTNKRIEKTDALILGGGGGGSTSKKA